MRIAFIGFGEAARAFRESLAAHDSGIGFSAYDILLDSEGDQGACAAAMRAHGVAVARSPEEAVAGAELVFSAVTADQSLVAARAAAPSLGPGQVLFDINSVSPGRKRESAALLGTTGAAYIDMAVMAPVHPRGHRTPALLAGPVDEKISRILLACGFAFETVGPEAGAATAIKMVRSLFVKGLEAITVETLIAAEASGCRETVLASLKASYPGLGLDELAPYQFERTIRHGRRRAAEMRESAVTLDELGLTGALAAAIADVQESMGALDNSICEERDIARLAARSLEARKGRTS